MPVDAVPTPPVSMARKSGQRLPAMAAAALKSRRFAAFYGIPERQFRKTFAEADRREGQTGENLLQLLEGRLDAVAYRMGFGGFAPNRVRSSVTMAFWVNGRRVNIRRIRCVPAMSCNSPTRRVSSCAPRLRWKRNRVARYFPSGSRSTSGPARGCLQGLSAGAPRLPASINEGLIVELTALRRRFSMNG